MKTPKKWFKTIAVFLTGLILLQSCSIYKTPVSLEEAAQQEMSVKIITVDDETYKYNYIVYEDGQFYGVKDNPGEDVRFPIETEEVANVLMKEGGLPTWAWIVIGVAVVAIIVIIIVAEQTEYGGWYYQ